MSTILSKNIKTIIMLVVAGILILSIPSTIEVIYNCGKDFGYNVMKLILSLI